jgi:hypothetical protein
LIFFFPEEKMQTLIQKFSTVLVLGGLLLFGFQCAAMAADADSCTAITAVPFTISAPGSYCVTKELTTTSSFTSGNAITIITSNVTIDLGGHTLSNLPAGTGTNAAGILAADQKDITIMNGTVTGFYEGIFMNSSAAGISSGYLVENMRIDRNRGIGIYVDGAGSIIRQNQVLHTGGFVNNGITGPGTGIFAGGDGVQVLDNTVADTVAGTIGSGYGIYIESPNSFSGAVVEHNRVSAVGQPNAYSVGITVQTNAHNTLVVDNRISNTHTGIEMYTATEYRDNLTINTITPYNGGTSEGNNQ